METFHIHITGIVQGVGFRPFVFQLAQKHGLHGWVNNTHDGVHIEITTTGKQAGKFYQHLIEHPPKLAVITSHTLTKVATKNYPAFTIIDSNNAESPSLPLTPDFALCADCRQDIEKANDRRYNYAFTTCTNCGPRYSIITSLPYDRPHTTMKAFSQCPECEQEYNNPLNRRHFSQTNSCPACGISLFCDGKTIAIDEIVTLLQQDKIIAIKGIGGFLLMTNAASTSAIATLRNRKHRPTKPFAIMYPDPDSLRNDFIISKEEERWLTNEVSPIVLLQPRANNQTLATELIAPGLNRLGCMLPYTPLFHLILKKYGQPVIATSGNVSGSPIIYTNQGAEEELTGIADSIITNNRDIVIPQDDSVLSFTGSGQKIILRRSRGLAPTVLTPGFTPPAKNILATGAQMKSSFAFTHKGQFYLSQYLGDMDNYLTQTAYQHTINHFFKVFKASPRLIISDLHPNYFTTLYGRQLANELSVPFLQVQHHQAHFYSVLAENKLLGQNEPVLGVIWDGTGYGTDGQVWGGESFVYKNDKVRKVAHIPYYPFILGDKMPREPRISALAITPQPTEIADKFTDTEFAIYTKLLGRPRLFSSSMGRLFDAVAAMVLGIDKTSYEGEAAMQLEAAASAWLARNQPQDYGHYLLAPEWDDILTFLWQQITADIVKSEPAGKIAAKFHLFLVDLISHQAARTGVKQLAFSGGVMQNNLLVELINTNLGNQYALFFHQQLPANDENIAFGQLAYYARHAEANP